MDDLHVKRGIGSLALLLSSAGLCAATSAAEVAQDVSPTFEAQDIKKWKANGAQGIWIQVAGGRWLYATFLQPCNELPSSISARFRWSLSADMQVAASVMTTGGAVCAVRRVDEVRDAGSTTPRAGRKPDPDLEGVVVQGGLADSVDKTQDVPRCGVRSIVWALTRPGSAWRLIAPVENTDSASACIRSSPDYRWSPGITP
jgi:hypothetical protein